MGSWSPGKALESPLSVRSPRLGLAAVSGQLLCRFPHGLRREAGRMRHLGRVLPCTLLGSEGCWQALSLSFPSVQQVRFWLPSQLQLFLPAGINRPGPVPALKQLHSCKWILQLPVLNNHVLFLHTINQLLPSTQRWLQAQGGALEERWWYIKLRSFLCRFACSLGRSGSASCKPCMPTDSIQHASAIRVMKNSIIWARHCSRRVLFLGPNIPREIFLYA